MSHESDTLNKAFQAFIAEASSEEQQLLLTLLQRMISQKDHTYMETLLTLNKHYNEKDNTLTIELPISPVTLNRFGIIHGGITSFLMDDAMGSLGHYNVPDDQTVVTTNMNVHFLKPGNGQSLTVKANMLKGGKKHLVASASIYDDHDQEIAYATCSFASVPLP